MKYFSYVLSYSTDERNAYRYGTRVNVDRTNLIFVTNSLFKLVLKDMAGIVSTVNIKETVTFLAIFTCNLLGSL